MPNEDVPNILHVEKYRYELTLVARSTIVLGYLWTVRVESTSDTLTVLRPSSSGTLLAYQSTEQMEVEPDERFFQFTELAQYILNT